MEHKERVERAIEAIRKGQIIIVTDDETRENEGDLVMAAQYCTQEQMAFFMRHSSGIICAPLTLEIAKDLDLPLMVEKNDCTYHTAFTVSIDYRYGTTTGISAFDRMLAVNKLADLQSTAQDFVRPGHIFPLIACENGVLARAGHTEAAVDLCLLAGIRPVGVIGELVNDDGSVTKNEDIAHFAKTYNLIKITVADLIAYRQAMKI